MSVRIELAQAAIEGRCKTCAHWRPITKAWAHSFDGEAGKCGRSNGSGGAPDHEDTLAYADDLESYRAALVTRPNFGCVMWEAKP